MRKGKVSTTFARHSAGETESVEIDFQHTKKIANYENFSYALIRETVEIVAECKAINRTEHVLVEQCWREIIRNRRVYEKKRK